MAQAIIPLRAGSHDEVPPLSQLYENAEAAFGIHTIR